MPECSRTICPSCDKWTRKLAAEGVCNACKKKLSKKKLEKKCRLPGCPKTLKGGANKFYCSDHTALSSTERKREIARLTGGNNEQTT